MTFQSVAVAVLAAIILPSATLLASEDAEDESKLGWSITADFSFILTAGNSESTTLGFGGTTSHKSEKALLEASCGALKVETTSDLDVAIGTPDDFTIPEVTETTAETFFAAVKYNRDISDRLFWYTGAGWLRNEPAGIKNRYVISGGVGNIWRDNERVSFRTNYGVSYTNQQDVVDISLVASSFPGVLLSSNLTKAFGKDRAEYGNIFVFNYSLEDSENWRWNMEQWLSSSLTDRLSLKITLTWLFNNVPAFREVGLLEGDPPEDQGNTVLVQLEKLDTIFGVSLVVDF
jgi:hypothetical protein